jgi:hypothetical protein
MLVDFADALAAHTEAETAAIEATTRAAQAEVEAAHVAMHADLGEDCPCHALYGAVVS